MLDNRSIITALTFLPLVFALLVLIVPNEQVKGIRIIAMLGTVANFVLSILMLIGFDGNTARMQFQQSVPWIPNFGINYHVGIDGISLWLLMLTTFLSVIVVGFSFNIKVRVKEYMFFMLLLQTGMIGVFVSLDLILFYLFWEAMLIPMYFLIGIWGGERRIYASLKFFLYTFFGSVLMLVAIIILYNLTGARTFDLVEIQNQLATQGLPRAQEMWLFAAFALAFAIKVPMFPFHTWLPDAHVEAPTAGSVILAGVLLKMGTYGFMRFCIPLFPDASQAAAGVIMTIAVIGIIYGAIVATVQPDMKKLVAYSSVSHLGFVMLGLFALNEQGLTGSLIQQVNHGISTGALFLLVGFVYERRHTRMIEDYGGLKRVMPLYAACFMIIMLSSIGLPGMNGFIGEILCLLGGYQANHVLGILGATGLVLGAVYMLWMFQRVFYGKAEGANLKMKDLNYGELAMIIPLIIMVFWIGLRPGYFIDKMRPSINNMIMQKEKRIDATWKNLDSSTPSGSSAGTEVTN
ncbi:MAG: complex I subunit 4 family protein [Armatimonadota bacterium]